MNMPIVDFMKILKTITKNRMYLAIMISFCYILLITLFLPNESLVGLWYSLIIIFLLSLQFTSYILTGKYIASEFYPKNRSPFRGPIFAIIALYLTLLSTYILIFM